MEEGKASNHFGALTPGKVVGCECAHMAPLGIEHFFDAFCFDPQRLWGTAAIQALGIPSCIKGGPSGEHACEHFLAYASAYSS